MLDTFKEAAPMPTSDDVRQARHRALEAAWTNARLEGVVVDEAARNAQLLFADGLISEDELHARLQMIPVE